MILSYFSLCGGGGAAGSKEAADDQPAEAERFEEIEKPASACHSDTHTGLLCIVFFVHTRYYLHVFAFFLS